MKPAAATSIVFFGATVWAALAHPWVVPAFASFLAAAAVLAPAVVLAAGHPSAGPRAWKGDLR